MAWTAAKRKSVQGYTPGINTPWPNATPDVGWRAAVVGLFAMDSAPEPSSGGGGISIGTGISPDVGISQARRMGGAGISYFIALMFGAWGVA
jgi:hypothetical protein